VKGERVEWEGGVREKGGWTVSSGRSVECSVSRKKKEPLDLRGMNSAIREFQLAGNRGRALGGYDRR